jgi:hypothetical protein
MKKSSVLFALVALALPGLSMAQDSTAQCPKHSKHHPAMDSTQKQLMKEGMELRRQSFDARKAYFDAYAAGKDAEVRKAELIAVLDRLHAFEKANLEAQAKFFASLPKDSTGRPLRGPHDGKGLHHPKAGGPGEHHPESMGPSGYAPMGLDGPPPPPVD